VGTFSGLMGGGVETPFTLTIERVVADRFRHHHPDARTPERVAASLNYFREIYQRGEILPIYRSLRLVNFSDLRTADLGIWWSYSRDCTRPVGDYADAEGNYKAKADYRWYLVEGRVHRDSVNWLETVAQGVSYGILLPVDPEGDPNEQTMQERTGGWLMECEITLKPGAEIKLLGWAEKIRDRGDKRDEPWHEWGPTQPFPKSTTAFAGVKK
jgi:hypothetical protein